MHYQIIVEYAFDIPIEVAEGSEDQPSLGYIQTFGVNAPDHAAAIGKVQDWLELEEETAGFIAGIDSDMVLLEDWPDEVREEFSADPAKPGIYFATEQVHYNADDETFEEEEEEE